MRYRELEHLPAEIQDLIARLAPSQDCASWVKEPIPVLDGRSVLDVMNDPHGEPRVRGYLTAAIGKFG